MGTLNEDIFVNGNLSSSSFTPPSGSISNTAIAGNAQIDATKVVHQFPLFFSVKNGTAVTTTTELIHIARAAGTVVAIEVATPTPPTSSDTVVIDLEKGSAAGAFASILTSPHTLNSSSVAKTVYSPTVSSAAYVDNNLFQVKLTVSGSSCQGIIVTVWLRENPQ